MIRHVIYRTLFKHDKYVYPASQDYSYAAQIDAKNLRDKHETEVHPIHWPNRCHGLQSQSLLHHIMLQFFLEQLRIFSTVPQLLQYFS